MIYGPPRRISRFFAGTLAGLAGILGLHLLLNGGFSQFSRILRYAGIPSNVGFLQAFWLPEPPGWNVMCVAGALAAGFALRLKGGRPASVVRCLPRRHRVLGGWPCATG